MFVSKKCGKCGEQKPVDEFHRSSRGDGFQAWCKPCRKVYDAAYHQLTLDRRRARDAERRAEFQRWYQALKEGKPCTDCGESFPAGAMQFDHRPGQEKRGNVGDLARKLSKNLVIAEIAKCDLVCATCHAIRTVGRRETGRGAAW